MVHLPLGPKATRAAAVLALSIASVGACTVLDRTPPADAVFSEGCGEPLLETVTQARSIEVDGVERHYRLRPPGSYDPDFPFPLLIGLHGAGDDGDAIREYSEIESQAANRAILIFPDALEGVDGIPRWTESDAAFLDAISAELADELCVDTSRVYAFGFSSGASMANYWACTSERVRGFAAMAGGPPPAGCLGPREAWIAHDRGDPVVDIGYGEQARAAWQSENGCSTSTEAFSPGPCERYACDDAELVWCEDDLPAVAAHSWPPWASPSLWAFFEAI